MGLHLETFSGDRLCVEDYGDDTSHILDLMKCTMLALQNITLWHG